MDLIDRNAVLNRYQEICKGVACMDCPFYKDGCAVEKLILDSAVVEAEPVIHGRWIWVEDVPLEDGETEYDREAWYQCSECDAYDLRLKDCHSDYCWSCGAKMDLDEVNE